jgi:6-phosphogluconolactonase
MTERLRAAPGGGSSARTGNAVYDCPAIHAVRPAQSRAAAAAASEAEAAAVRIPLSPVRTGFLLAGSLWATGRRGVSRILAPGSGASGTLGAEVQQATAPDGGLYGHQVPASPDNGTVILVTRGNDATDGKPEDPGVLKVFGFRDGQLTLRQSVAPNGGRAFGPRHIDFHPTLPLVFVSLERQDKLQVYGLRDGTMTPEPIFTTDTLQRPGAVPPAQLASTLHVHPGGRYLYLANRSDTMGEYQGRPFALEGESSIAVFELDATTGLPWCKARTRAASSRAPSRSILRLACW